MRPRFADCLQCILFTGRIVTLSYPVSLFSSPHRAYQPLAWTILHGSAWLPRTRRVNPCGNDWPGGWDCPMKISVRFINVSPWKSQIFSLFGVLPLPVGLVLSTAAPNWAALTLNICTQHCAHVSHIHAPPQNSASKHPGVAYEVKSHG